MRSSILLDSSNKPELAEVEVDEEEIEQHETPHTHRVRKPRERYSSINNPRYLHEMNADSESDCESCRNTVTYASKKGLPQAVRDSKSPNIILEVFNFTYLISCFAVSALAYAEAGERNLISYVMNIRPIKWLRYMTIPWLLPLDLAFAACTK